ncbi:xyppx repeat family protein [Stylonychia lemnae]|uniref:Xyppx repeat family protein n=1 Tax=Stylonychia lemnae TaxID=5949 RepID=A0A078AJU9_STYLE|nr:xyppx repeat family protein [Stylonychia lemnae]|eukprot:CDW82660.1 xyppx repeat family protein [Stylonychia lemnae]
MDPYVIIKCGNTTKKTLVNEGGGKKPKWNETLIFEITYEKSFSITVMDKDMSFDDIVGQGEVELDSVFRSGKTSSSYNLGYKGKQAGQIFIDLEFYSSSNLGMPSFQTLPGQHQLSYQQPQMMQQFGYGMQQQYLQPMGYVPPGGFPPVMIPPPQYYQQPQQQIYQPPQSQMGQPVPQMQVQQQVPQYYPTLPQQNQYPPQGQNYGYSYQQQQYPFPQSNQQFPGQFR